MTYAPDTLKVPEMLEPFADALRAAVKPYAVFGRLPKGTPEAALSAQGSTRIGGPMDVPKDAPWRAWAEALNEGRGSFHDELCFMFQLNLAEMPAEVRPAHVPAKGVVWVLMDLSDRWSGEVKFDPRDACDIPWLAQGARHACSRGWHPELKTSLPDVTAGVVPGLEWVAEARDYWDSMDEWMKLVPGGTGPYHGDLQLGGWCWPIQGDFEERNRTFVAGMYGCDFGDAGSLELHYDAAQARWFVEIDTH